MMAASSIRIGNIVASGRHKNDLFLVTRSNYSPVFSIRRVNLDGKYKSKFSVIRHFKSLRPVLVTNELLLLVGFKSKFWLWRRKSIFVLAGNSKITLKTHRDHFHLFSSSDPKKVYLVKYMHELQNFCEDVFHEEITFNFK